MRNHDLLLLCIDVGNTHTGLALSDGERILEHWRIRTQTDITTDEAAVLFNGLFQLRNRRMADITHAIVTSVVPHVNRALSALFEQYLEVDGLFVDHETDTGMPVRYKNPAEVGADRIVNAVGAYDKFRCACIVVDLGTATTFDCVSSEGAYLGGAIAPGLMISMQALVSRGSRLPKLERISKPPAAIACSTLDSMNSGLLYGYAGLVDGVLTRMKQEMGGRPIVVATGGIAPVLQDVSEHFDVIEPLLTFEGLEAIFRRRLSFSGRVELA